MKFVTVSDVHIKEPNDDSEKLFLAFLNSKQTSESDVIYLLGDIFDLMVGGHENYYRKHQRIFEKLVDLCGNGKKIIQFEGNHDFHFEKLLGFIKNKHDLSADAWVYEKTPLIIEVNGVKTMFAHGDEIEIENLSYNIYKAFIRSFPIKFLANNVVPFRIVDGIGQYLSKKSRNRNNKRYSDELVEYVKDKFRRTFRLTQKNYKIENLICGHSHCLDHYSDNGIYLNNGYFPATKVFNYFNGEGYEQISINQQAAE